MKRLTLVRHAQAEPALAGQTDFERVLTRRGSEDANEMSRRLKRRKWVPDLILASTAIRALSTAEIFGTVLRATVRADDRIYTAGPQEYLRVLKEVESEYAHVMIVAHNPGITEFADRLCSERTIDAMPTCAIVTMSFAVSAWSGVDWDLGVEVEFDYPGQVG